MDRINFNKNVKMQRACSNDELRPAMNNIYFKDGYAYATDGHILVKNALSECSTITEEQISLLDGKMLSAKNYTNILKYDIITVSDDGIEAVKGEDKAFFYFSKLDAKYPDAEKVLQNELNKQTVPLPEVGLNLDSLIKLNAALSGSNLCKLTFKGESSSVIFSSMDTSSVGVIVPLLIH